MGKKTWSSVISALLLLLTCALQPRVAAPPAEPTAPSAVAIQKPTPTRGLPPGLEAPPRAHHAVVVRLSPDQPWTPRYTVDLSEPDITELLVPPPDLWPDTPTAQYLLAGLDDDEFTPDDFFDLAEAEGLLDSRPSELDDEWDRLVALWAMDLQAIMESEDDDDYDARVPAWVAEAQASLERSPDGLVADVLRAGIVYHHYTSGYVPPAGFEALCTDLAGSDDPRVQQLAVQLLASQPDADPASVLDLVAHQPTRLHTLLVAVDLAVDQQAWTEAEDLAARVAAHPDATELDRLDAADVAALARPPLELPWVRALAHEIRQCAGVSGPEQLELTVSGGVWTPTSEGPVADCLFGWAPSIGPEEAEVSVRVTR